jgi:hypothetical protein
MERVQLTTRDCLIWVLAMAVEERVGDWRNFEFSANEVGSLHSPQTPSRHSPTCTANLSARELASLAESSAILTRCSSSRIRLLAEP